MVQKKGFFETIRAGDSRGNNNFKCVFSDFFLKHWSTVSKARLSSIRIKMEYKPSRSLETFAWAVIVAETR